MFATRTRQELSITTVVSRAARDAVGRHFHYQDMFNWFDTSWLDVDRPISTQSFGMDVELMNCTGKCSLTDRQREKERRSLWRTVHGWLGNPSAVTCLPGWVSLR